MIDPVIDWFEMQQTPNKTATEVTDIAEKTWLIPPNVPQRLRSKNLTNHDQNPQANAIIELVHQTIGHIMHEDL
jgi:hypothetical protein